MQAQVGPGPHLQPPRTFGAVVRQARDALRRYRQDQAAARQAPQWQPDAAPPPGQLASGTTAAAAPAQQEQQDPPGPLLLQGCNRMLLELPLPVASLAPPGTPLMEQQFNITDEGDFPGGIVQRFRALRPLVDGMLEGYDPQFLGMLEDPADGMGCWSIGGDTTLVGIATNATFASFAKLCQGGYGDSVTRPGHTLVAVNPAWTGPQDIGQLWDRQLKAAAQQLLGSRWDVLYSCRLVRTSRGRGYGLLVASHGLGWHLWPAGADSSDSVRDECLLWSPSQPEPAEVIAAVNEAADAARGSSEQKGGLAALLGRWQRPR